MSTSRNHTEEKITRDIKGKGKDKETDNAEVLVTDNTDTLEYILLREMSNLKLQISIDDEDTSWEKQQTLSYFNAFRDKLLQYRLTCVASTKSQSIDLALKQQALDAVYLAKKDLKSFILAFTGWSNLNFSEDIEDPLKKALGSFVRVTKTYIEEENKSLIKDTKETSDLPVSDDFLIEIDNINNYLGGRARETKTGIKSWFSYSATDYEKRRQNWDNILRLISNTINTNDNFAEDKQRLIDEIDRSINQFKKGWFGKSARYAEQLSTLKDKIVEMDYNQFNQHANRISHDQYLYDEQIRYSNLVKASSGFSLFSEKIDIQLLIEAKNSLYTYHLKRKQSPTDGNFLSKKDLEQTERRNLKSW